MSTIIKPYDIGMIFKGDLALANLNGDKTHSRRPKNNILDKAYKLHKQGVPIRIWQRETFYCDHWQYPAVSFADMADGMMEYRAGFDPSYWEAGSPDCDENGRSCWKPAIHMPRWFSRFTGVDVEIVEERLHAAPLTDLQREGTPQENGVREGFAEVWDAAYGKDPDLNYLANPLIYALKYKGVNENIDRMGQ